MQNTLANAAFLWKTSWKKVTGERKKYPKVVQMPITYRCNPKCVTCTSGTFTNVLNHTQA